jgi:hypothetical protein
LPPLNFVLPTPDAAAPPTPPVVEISAPAVPAFAPTTTAVPAMLAQLVVALHRNVSVPLLTVPATPPAPIATVTGLLGVSDTFVDLDHAPPPPPGPRGAPAPPPIASIVLFALFQHAGTTKVVPLVMNVIVVPA